MAPTTALATPRSSSNPASAINHARSSGSRTTTTALEGRTQQPNAAVPVGTLRLRGEGLVARGRRPGIRWAEDVVDNEGLGRKSSKVCCIYHKPRAVGESSSESDDESSDEESDSDVDDGAARMSKGKGKGISHKCGKEGEGRKDVNRGRNAYEKMPKGGIGGTGTQTVK